jgi:hypothetical protein
MPRRSAESDTVYDIVYELAVLCSRDSVFLPLLNGYSAALSHAIDGQLVTPSFVVSLRRLVESDRPPLPDFLNLSFS